MRPPRFYFLLVAIFTLSTLTPLSSWSRLPTEEEHRALQRSSNIGVTTRAPVAQCHHEKDDPEQLPGGRRVCNESGFWEFEASNVPLPPRRPANLNQPPAGGTNATARTPAAPRAATGATTAGNSLDQKLASCKAAGQAVSTSCSSSGANSNASNFSGGALQSGQAMNAQEQAQVADMCRQAGQNAQQANATIEAIIQQCEGVISSCSSACSDVSEGLLNTQQKAELQSARNQCSSGSYALATLQNQQNQTQESADRAQQCLNEAGLGGGMNANADAKTLDCNKTPNAPGCLQAKQDCSNPEFAAANEICRCPSGNCSSATNRTNPVEGEDQSTTGYDESPTPDMTASNGLGIDRAQGYQSDRQDMSVTGGGGGGAGGGSAKGANQAGLKKGGAPSKIDTDLLNGTLGGRAGGFGRSSGEPAADSGSYSNSGSWIPPKVGREESPNLDRFRPNLDPKNFRGPSSNNVRSEIYASHVNMWRQVNLRYIQVMGTLKP
ncbi:MAG: hypothetical protein ACK5P7_05645 [Bdellovibrio sp.]|jgi:hypothetical protein